MSYEYYFVYIKVIYFIINQLSVVIFLNLVCCNMLAVIDTKINRSIINREETSLIHENSVFSVQVFHYLSSKNGSR